MIRRAIASAALVLLPSASFGQTVIGVVVEDGTQIPLAGVTVRLIDEKGRVIQDATSDSIGAFKVSRERAGVGILHFQHPAYTSLLAEPLTLGREEVVAVEARLAPSAIALEPLIVESRVRDRLLRFRNRVSGPGFGRFVTREEIEQRPAARASDLLRMMPGIQIVRTGGLGAGFNLITMRGPLGQCMPALFLDGVTVQQDIDHFLFADNLEGIEVYVGEAGVPGELKNLSNCGAVGFWTRPYQGGQNFSMKRLGLMMGVTAVSVAIGSLLIAD